MAYVALCDWNPASLTLLCAALPFAHCSLGLFFTDSEIFCCISLMYYTMCWEYNNGQAKDIVLTEVIS